MDAEGVQRTRDSNSCEAGEKSEGVEGKSGQDVRFSVPYCRVQAKTRLPRLPQGRRRTCEARRRQLLASQVPCNVCDAVSMGRCRSPHGAAMVVLLGDGVDLSVFEALPHQAG